jgi:Reverse transcriptase (RNA-dependent DNA polymerase)/DNA N-6-adenine-methyltransferase (Dam)
MSPLLHQRVTSALHNWRAIGADKRILSFIRDGVPVEFLGGKPPPPFHCRSIPAQPTEELWWLQHEEPRLLALGAISRIDNTGLPRPAHIHSAFCVPKPEPNNYRVVVNLKRTNIAQKGYKCRYETLKLLRRWGMQGSFMFKMDLADAYYHFRIRESDRKYFTFEFCNRLYQMNVLPFGWLNSPYYFSKIMRTVVRFWRDPLAVTKKYNTPPPAPPHCLFPPARRWSGRRPTMARPGLKVLPYLDDFLFVCKTEEQAKAAAVWVRTTIEFLGLSAHPKKCVWDPSQSLQHLGITINSRDGFFEVPTEKLAKLRRMAVDLKVTAKKTRRLVTKRDLAKFCGFAQSIKLAITPAQLFLRNLYDDVSQRASWSGKIRLSRRSLRDLDWWADLPRHRTRSVIALQPATRDLSVDSSDFAWGAVLDGRTARSYWSDSERAFHINHKELRAVHYALLTFLPLVANSVVRVKEDNTVTQAILGRWSSRSRVLFQEFRLLWQFMDQHGIILQVERVASADNLADAPSRFIDHSDYKLHHKIFQRLERLYGPHDIDLFASNLNAQLPCFFSQFHCPGSSGVNSLIHTWHGSNCYANPPFDADTLLSVVQKIAQERCAITLVVPYWTAQPWWQLLMEMAVDMVFLPRTHNLFTPGLGPRSSSLPPPAWEVVAVRVEWPSGP